MALDYCPNGCGERLPRREVSYNILDLMASHKIKTIHSLKSNKNRYNYCEIGEIIIPSYIHVVKIPSFTLS